MKLGQGEDQTRLEEMTKASRGRERQRQRQSGNGKGQWRSTNTLSTISFWICWITWEGNISMNIHDIQYSKLIRWIYCNFQLDFLLTPFVPKPCNPSSFNMVVFAEQKITSTNSGDDHLEVSTQPIFSEQAEPLVQFLYDHGLWLEIKLISLKSEENKVNYCRLDHWNSLSRTRYCRNQQGILILPTSGPPSRHYPTKDLGFVQRLAMPPTHQTRLLDDQHQLTNFPPFPSLPFSLGTAPIALWSSRSPPRNLGPRWSSWQARWKLRSSDPSSKMQATSSKISWLCAFFTLNDQLMQHIHNTETCLPTGIEMESWSHGWILWRWPWRRAQGQNQAVFRQFSGCFVQKIRSLLTWLSSGVGSLFAGIDR